MPPLDDLACPVCKHELREVATGIECVACGRVWPRRGELIDFVPRPDPDGAWEERQQEMVEWYDELVADRAGAVQCLQTDYEAIRPALRALSGTVLDVGGGAGITRRYLAPTVEYVNLDPSLAWLDSRWSDVLSSFSVAPEQPMSFVRGVGEQLPFRDRRFDAVLSLWSLNHASSVGLVLEECGRVLRQGGLLLLVLEDIEPRWRDLLRPPLRHARRMRRRKAAVAIGARSWPVQSDHTRIDEDELLTQVAGQFDLARREWVGAGPPSYLSLALRRR